MEKEAMLNWYMQLCDDSIIIIVADWLQFIDLYNLDNAICNHTDRPAWLELFKIEHFPPIPSNILNACVRQMITQRSNTKGIDCNKINTEKTDSMWYMKYKCEDCRQIKTDIFCIQSATEYLHVQNNHYTLWKANKYELRDSVLIPFMYEILNLSQHVVSLFVQLSCSNLQSLSNHIFSKFNANNKTNCIKNLTHLDVNSTNNCVDALRKLLSLTPLIQHIDLTFGDNADLILQGLESLVMLTTAKLTFKIFRKRDFCAFNSLISDNSKLQVCILRSSDISLEYMQINKNSKFVDITESLSPDLYWQTRGFEYAWHFLKDRAASDQSNSLFSYLYIPYFISVSFLEMLLRETVQATYLHFDGALDHTLSVYHIPTLMCNQSVDSNTLLVLIRQNCSHLLKAVKFDEQHVWIKV